MTWPSQAEVLKGKSMYGNPRGANGRANPAWVKENIVTLQPPFKMTFAGHPIRSIQIHKLCKDSLLRVLIRIKEAAHGDDKLLATWGISAFGGSFVYRLMRGSNTLSMHSYGCALDFDPARNGLGDKTPHFADIHEVRAAFKAENWTWGGDWDDDGSVVDSNRPDGMHWQATQAVK